ncbi:DoxX-like family protein [Flavobacterium beibuense F44-8]|uniref:DoxX-like family protein n=1 Tax=Flavobacterium beibuense F44-8 TaxID=1406840 RepID=A0A0A2LIA3_9FLAO|nr:DoxX family protein [Flavobacterium beibuense]KGO79952.1 DoxX-like family protein [Flavobacterium beibuense F44-8]
MTKRNKIIYWIATIWLALGMLSTGIVQLLKTEDEVTKITQLGYPVYILTILGIWKILGVVVMLLPKMPVVKEWAYAGFFFTMTGAVVSHLVSGSPVGELFGPVLLIVLTVVSWYLRPESRNTNQLKTISNEQ